MCIIIVHNVFHTSHFYIHGRIVVGLSYFMLFKVDGAYGISVKPTVDSPDVHSYFGVYERLFRDEYPIEREMVNVY